MSATPTVRNYHVIIDAPPEAVYDVMNDLHNMPSWSVHFCKSIRVIPGDGAMVQSPAGEVYFGITGDRDLGVLDWWSGPTMETAQRWPTRVTALPDGRSLYVITALLSKTELEMPNLDQIFADELGALKRLVETQTVVA
jgi:hypothetical protein